jgi:hypothetical protein
MLLILTIAKADDSTHPPAAFARWITARRMHHISWQKADLDDDKECSPAVGTNAASNWRSFGTSRCSSQKNLHRFALRPKGRWRPFMARCSPNPGRPARQVLGVKLPRRLRRGGAVHDPTRLCAAAFKTRLILPHRHFASCTCAGSRISVGLEAGDRTVVDRRKCGSMRRPMPKRGTGVDSHSAALTGRVIATLTADSVKVCGTGP